MTSMGITAKLQWGRNFIVAEICSRDVPLIHVIAASMGPQLYRCGNAIKTGATIAVGIKLQWGRNFIVAEMPLPT